MTQPFLKILKITFLETPCMSKSMQISVRHNGDNHITSLKRTSIPQNSLLLSIYSFCSSNFAKAKVFALNLFDSFIAAKRSDIYCCRSSCNRSNWKSDINYIYEEQQCKTWKIHKLKGHQILHGIFQRCNFKMKCEKYFATKSAKTFRENHRKLLVLCKFQ